MNKFWLYVTYLGLVVLLVSGTAKAVSLTIPAGGTQLLEAEYDSNNDLIETAVSQLDAVDATKHTWTLFQSFSTNEVTRNNAKHTWSLFQAYSTYQATVADSKVETSAFTSFSTNEVTRNATKHDKSAFSSYSTINLANLATKHDKSAFTSYSTINLANLATKHDKSAFTSYSTIHPYIQKFFKYQDASNATYFSNDSTIPLDDTTPLPTEGGVVNSFSYTPVAAGHNLDISADINVFMPTINKNVIFTAFVNNTCIDVRTKDSAVANIHLGIALEGDYTTYSTDPIVIQTRIGSNDGTTLHVNGDAGSRLFGGASKSHLSVKETE